MFHGSRFTPQVSFQWNMGAVTFSFGEKCNKLISVPGFKHSVKMTCTRHYVVKMTHRGAKFQITQALIHLNSLLKGGDGVT